ncbi:caspase domain-containing protein [Streptomyces sp. NPDC096136]|uniref:caspase family protein n=1 Tax=Streptomyces sp. NPDC096136 TaxID=3366076 RepID=UPI0037FB1F64
MSALILAARTMRIPHGHQLAESTVQRWFGPYDTFVPPAPERHEQVLAAIHVMLSWAGEPVDLGNWLSYLELAYSEHRSGVGTLHAQPASLTHDPDVEVWLIRRRVELATPEELGSANRYKTFCLRAGVPIVKDGYGLLLLEDARGQFRRTLMTRNVAYVRQLAKAENARPGWLQNASLPRPIFTIKRDGWPDDWSSNPKPAVDIPDDEPVSQWLARMMRDAGVTTSELAQALGGINRAVVSTWLSGRAVPADGKQEEIKEYLLAAGEVAAFLDDHHRQTPSPLRCWQNGAAVIIGVSAYTKMEAVPSISNNIASLKDLMTSGLGIPERSVFLVSNPTSGTEIHQAIEEAAETADPASGALLVYFSGHGWTDRGRLMLGLTDSSRSRQWSALDFNNLRIQIADSQISSRVVILDSCYSGAALDILGPEDLADAAAIDGTCVLTASNATTAALAPSGERFTTFTGHLIAALTEGIPQGPSVINTDSLYRYIERAARERGFPLPGRQIGGDGDRVEIMPNRWRGRP